MKLRKYLCLAVALMLGSVNTYAVTSSNLASSTTDTYDCEVNNEQLYFTFISEDGEELETVPFVKLDFMEEMNDGVSVLSSLSLSYWNFVNSDYEGSFGLKDSTRTDWATRYFSPNSSNNINIDVYEGYSDGPTVYWNAYQYYTNGDTSYIGSVEIPKEYTSLKGGGRITNCNANNFYTFLISKDGYSGYAAGNYTVSH